MSQWQQRDYPAGDAPFRAAELSGPQPAFRDELDAARSMYRRTPDAQYPDGYIGTVNSRRQDRLYGGLKARSDNKPYSRGVHKGEKVDNRDYLWPQEFRPELGLVAQSEGHKFISEPMLVEAGFAKYRPPADDEPKMARVGTKGLPARVGTVNWGETDSDRAAALKRLAPSWSAGPGMGTPTPYPGR